jgi:hypothetical protein
MKIFTKTNLATAVFLAVQSFNANSLVIDLAITSTSTATADGITVNDSDTANNSSPPGVAESEAEVLNDPSANYGYAHSIGRSNGSFYNKAAGDATFTSAGHVSQLYTVTNDQSITQNIDFDFQVLWGGISANCGGFFGEEDDFFDEVEGPSGAPCSGNDFALAAYSAQILLDGASIWDSAAQIRTDAAGTVGASTGVDLSIGGYTATDTSYYWGKQDFTLELGSLAAGESFQLEYMIDVYAEGFLSNGDYNYASAQFGDPNGFGATGNSFNSAAAVPEPMTLGLLASGLFSLGFVSRRRRKS